MANRAAIAQAVTSVTLGMAPRMRSMPTAAKMAPMAVAGGRYYMEYGWMFS
jgi:hypothetical protein